MTSLASVTSGLGIEGLSRVLQSCFCSESSYCRELYEQRPDFEVDDNHAFAEERTQLHPAKISSGPEGQRR